MPVWRHMPYMMERKDRPAGTGMADFSFKSTGVPNVYQLLMRLQFLREQIHDWQRQTQQGELGPAVAAEVLAALQGLAIAARQEGLSGFSMVCVRTGEQIEPLARLGQIAASTLLRLRDWIQCAEQYLRCPANHMAALALVAQLEHADWPVALSSRERLWLVTELTAATVP
jgi:hypothetical protein